MATEMAMLNVRMERELREQGNEVLAKLGITPSQYVRAMWQRLVDVGWHRAAWRVDEVMASGRTSEQQVEIDRKLAALEGIDHSFYAFAEELGLDPSTHVAMTDEELEEERYAYLNEKYGA